MRRFFFITFAICALFAGIFGTMRPAKADASDELKSVLSEVRSMSNHDFDDLVGWAKKGGNDEPFSTTFEPGKTEGAILKRGFAAVKKDGTGVIACISFKNIDTKVADRVVFSFPILGNSGPNDAVVLDRRGEFTPNIDIRAYESMASWQTVGSGPRTLGDGCIRRDFPTAVLPLLQAQATGYTLMRVEYVDGSSWPAPPAPPAPPPSPH